MEKIHPTKALEKIHPTKTGVHVIAIFEAVKGTLGLIAGFGILSLIHRDIAEFADDLVEVLHLNSEGHLAHRIVETVTRLNPSNIKVFFFLALLYSAVRFIEAYGLWRLRAWAEWFAIISGSLYVPVEIYEIFQKPTVFRVLILLANIAIVLYLYSFRREQKHEQEIHESEIAEQSH
ncbi:MAG TPA: DUF2127 domain-containing protein [Pyrinomonadaceae bacterium]